jgi:hypothetical protein
MARLRGMHCYAARVRKHVAQSKGMLTLGKLGEQTASFVERVLDVRQGELCWVVGTVYMEMAEKPNVLDDIAKDVRFSPQKYQGQPLTLHSTG